VSSLSPSKRRSSSSCPVDRVEAFARTIPTDAPESDGTLEWDSTTIVVVQAFAVGTVGLGYTYTHDAAVRLIEDKLAQAVRGVDVERDTSRAWHEMGNLLRNVGRPGLGFMALSAVDIALWDLRARLLGRPLVDVLGSVRDEAAVYGSGGFTSYSLERIAEQFADWVAQGIPRVKMKVGRAWTLRASRSATRPSSSSTPTARSTATTPSRGRTATRTTGESAGSRSRSAPPTPKASATSVSMRRSTSRPASTRTFRPTSKTSCARTPSTACSWM
jgi:hypothetical protein